MATANLDRLLHHFTTINIKVVRYRLRDKRKAGQSFPKMHVAVNEDNESEERTAKSEG